MKKYIAILISFMVLFNGCASRTKDSENITFKNTPPILTDRDRREVELGEQIHQKILQSFPVYDDPAVNDYVTDVGRRLIPFVKRDNLPYKFTILEDSRIYSSCAPGGYIYITTGFLALLDNEAELAAVLAHEIAQVQYRPPDPRVKKLIMNSRPILAMGAGIFLGVFTPFALIAVDGLTYYTMLEKKKSDRSVKADKRAFEYMVQAGYDPQGAIDLFYHLMEFDESQISMIYNYNISHPLTNKRFDKIIEAYSKLDLTEVALTTDRNEFHQTMNELREQYASDTDERPNYCTLPNI